MIKLDKPTDIVGDILEKCICSYRDEERKARLKGCIEIVETAAEEYDERATQNNLCSFKVHEKVGEVTKDEMKDLYDKKFVKQPGRVYYDTSEQVKELLEKTKNSDIEHIIVLCVYYGLRRSEVLGLKWDAVNFNDNTIRICNTVTKMYGLCEKERTKNSSSNRTLPLISVVKKYLLKLKEEQKEYKKLFGKCYFDSEYICVKKDGSLITPDDASYKFREFLKKNNLPHIRLHDLRHSCASMLIAQGVDIKVIQEWLGHSSIATTGNIYGHLQFKQKIETGNMLENLLEN